MARLWAIDEARDIDFRTPGVIDRMADERNKYNPSYRNSEPSEKDYSSKKRESK